MAKTKTVKQKKVKSPYSHICGICGKGCNSLHTVFSDEHKEVKGILQCVFCLGHIENKNQ